MRWYTIVWLSWAALGIAFELYVLIFGIENATLSEQLWRLRDRGGGWFSLLMFFLAWMIYHFIRENVATDPTDLPLPPSPPPTPDGS